MLLVNPSVVPFLHISNYIVNKYDSTEISPPQDSIHDSPFVESVSLVEVLSQVKEQIPPTIAKAQIDAFFLVVFFCQHNSFR